MTAKDKNLSGTDTGRASISVPELEPIFSFPSGRGGDVYVYLAKSEICSFAVITFDDTSDEYAYAVETLTGPTDLDAKNLVSKAAKEWSERPNPFKELLKNHKAMKKLAEILNEASRVSENE